MAFGPNLEDLIIILKCVSEEDKRATGGRFIFIKKGIFHEVLELDIVLEAVAVKVFLHKIILYLMYIFHHVLMSHKVILKNLVNQLPAFFYLLVILMHRVIYGVVPHPIV